jgi:hypothetical protein
MQYVLIGHRLGFLRSNRSKYIEMRHGCNIYIRGESISESRLLNEKTGKSHTQK